METLAAFSLFETLDERDVVALDRACGWRRVRAGEWVLDQGAGGSDLFFVVRGRVRVLLTSAGRDIILREIDEGEFFGELAALDGHPRSAGILAVTDSFVACLPAPSFRSLLHKHPGVCDRLLSLLVSQIRMLANRIDEHTNLGVRERLYAELLRLAAKAKAKTAKLTISPPPTHLELSARIGSNREAVTRELNAMARRGTIERRRGAIVILDENHLRATIAASADC